MSYKKSRKKIGWLEYCNTHPGRASRIVSHSLNRFNSYELPTQREMVENIRESRHVQTIKATSV